jgi:hypothetical protein
VPLAADLAAIPLDNATGLLAEKTIASIASPQSDQWAAQSVEDLTMHRMPDNTIEDTINRLANDLAAFCFECLEEDVNSGDNIGISGVHKDQEAFEEEL